MPGNATQNGLHLPSLNIQGFRGIRDLSISRLGRVTLLAGKNGVGKTTVLDAVQVYAARGRYDALFDLLQNREELHSVIDAYGKRMMGPDFAALFHEREATENTCIRIGPESDADQLEIRKVIDDDTADGSGRKIPIFSGQEEALKVRFRDASMRFPWTLDGYPREFVMGTTYRRSFRINKNGMAPEMPCHSLGPGLLANREIARFWDKVALTDAEMHTVDALNFICGGEIERLTTIGDDEPPGRNGRRVIAKTKQNHPVPLRSMGDGAIRLFSIALALVNSADGFLLIDEAENGIHHSVQRDLWRMIFNIAAEYNVQVLATTHSYDCVRGFAQAMVEDKEADGALVRIEWRNERLRAVEYSKNTIKVISKQPFGTEVR